MQQTEKYALNLIETSDPFSPAALNENAQKTEAAIVAEASARQAETAALSQRVQVLELKKVVGGSYVGNNTFPRTFGLGFTPKVVIIVKNIQDSTHEIVAICTGYQGVIQNYTSAKISDGGFTISTQNSNGYYLNSSGQAYCYIAFG